MALVSANETLQLPAQEERPFGSRHTLEGEFCLGVATTGTADKDLAFVLGVEVDEVVASHEAGLHALGP